MTAFLKIRSWLVGAQTKLCTPWKLTLLRSTFVFRIHSNRPQTTQQTTCYCPR
jgi:hypothetical protein